MRLHQMAIFSPDFRTLRVLTDRVYGISLKMGLLQDEQGFSSFFANFFVMIFQIFHCSTLKNHFKYAKFCAKYEQKRLIKNPFLRSTSKTRNRTRVPNPSLIWVRHFTKNSSNHIFAPFWWTFLNVVGGFWWLLSWVNQSAAAIFQKSSPNMIWRVFFFVKTSLLTEVSLQIVHVPTFTLRSIKCDLIGGLDKRILQRLQVREFKDDWPLRPVGASRVTQVPQKCDLHSEHCFCKIKKKLNS